MRKIDIEEKKEILLNMLQKVHDFCNENGLRYSLAYGTLLGAIRHKGFIPWDDDIDLVMLRKDFNIFVEKFNSYTSELRVVSVNNNDKYNLFLAKVIHNHTLLVEDVVNPIELGVFIDIFVLDYIPEDKKIADRAVNKLIICQKIYAVKQVRPRKGRAVYKNLILKILQILLYPLDLHHFLKNIDYYCSTLAAERTEYCGALSSMVYGKKEIMKSEYYEEYMLAPFEGRMFFIPTNYDSILTRLYGDYMTPPPKDQQHTHHANSAYWRDS